MINSIRLPWFVVVLFVIDFALAGVFITDYFIGSPVQALSNFIDLDGECNFSAWYSSLQLFAVGLLLGVFAYFNFKRTDAKSWVFVFLPAIFFLLSLDESAQIHEWIAEQSDTFLPGKSRENTPFPVTGIWIFFLGFPFLALMLFIFIKLKVLIRGRGHVLAMFLAGVTVFLGSATTLDLLENFLPSEGTLRTLQIMFEELGEMVGVTILIWASCELLRSYNLKVSMNPIVDASTNSFDRQESGESNETR